MIFTCRPSFVFSVSAKESTAFQAFVIQDGISGNKRHDRVIRLDLHRA